MTSQIEEKKMLLQHLYNISLQIYDLFSSKEINEALTLISRKDGIIRNLKLLKNVQDDSFKELQDKIKLQEEKNIQFAIELKEQIGKELRHLNKNAQMQNIYNNQIMQGSIVDILE